MKIKTKILFPIIMLFLIGCEKKDQIETVEKSNIACEKRESIDMSQEAVGKRWFNANFNTSLDEIANLQGTCVAWGGDGKCAYSFETQKDVALSPKRKMVEASCNTIYGGLTYAFSGIEKEVKVSDISCLVGSESNNGVNIASTKNGNKHFVWEFYAVQ